MTNYDRGAVAKDTEVVVIAGDQSRVSPPSESGLIDSSMRVSKLLDFLS